MSDFTDTANYMNCERYKKITKTTYNSGCLLFCFMKRGTYLFILLQEYAWYVKHVSFNTYLVILLQSPNFYVKNMCIMQNTSNLLQLSCSHAVKRIWSSRHGIMLYTNLQIERFCSPSLLLLFRLLLTSYGCHVVSPRPSMHLGFTTNSFQKQC